MGDRDGDQEGTGGNRDEVMGRDRVERWKTMGGQGWGTGEGQGWGQMGGTGDRNGAIGKDRAQRRRQTGDRDGRQGWGSRM